MSGLFLKFTLLEPLSPLASVAIAALALLSGCASQEKKDPTDPAGQIKMGETYSAGTWKISKNDETATEWYRKAALQGDPEGEYRLGLCYASGLGVPKNEAVAVTWFSKAALGGNPGAQYALGNCYRLAEGVGSDLRKAYLWYNIAAASGNDDARQYRDALARRMTDVEIREAQRQSQEFWNKLKG
jgi:TPR repeat protein